MQENECKIRIPAFLYGMKNMKKGIDRSGNIV